MLFTEDLFVSEKEATVVSGTLEMVVGCTVTATTADCSPRLSARITFLREREGKPFKKTTVFLTLHFKELEIQKFSGYIHVLNEYY